jgi:hypothetical protein
MHTRHGITHTPAELALDPTKALPEDGLVVVTRNRAPPAATLLAVGPVDTDRAPPPVLPAPALSSRGLPTAPDTVPVLRVRPPEAPWVAPPVTNNREPVAPEVLVPDLSVRSPDDPVPEVTSPDARAAAPEPGKRHMAGEEGSWEGG